jgi:DNA-binding GntR family transcriptional regulator
MNIVKIVRDKIEDAIFTTRYKPGERLDEVRLAEEHNVSRTPIREALKQLAENGLIEIRHRRGATVANPSPHKIIEIFEVMSELEGAAGARAAQRLTFEDRSALIAAHERCVEAALSENPDRYYYDNEHFHQVIYSASHCGFLAEQCTALHRRLRPFRRIQLRVSNRLANSIKEHEQIVDAIIKGDAAQSRELLRSHVAIQSDRFSDFMATLATSFPPDNQRT